MPYAFTEHGPIMAATVHNSARAVQNEHICGARFRTAKRDTGQRSSTRGQDGRTGAASAKPRRHHPGNNRAIKALMLPKQPPRKRIGFQTPAGKAAASPIQSGRLHLLH